MKKKQGEKESSLSCGPSTTLRSASALPRHTKYPASASPDRQRDTLTHTHTCVNVCVSVCVSVCVCVRGCELLSDHNLPGQRVKDCGTRAQWSLEPWPQLTPVSPKTFQRETEAPVAPVHVRTDKYCKYYDEKEVTPSNTTRKYSSSFMCKYMHS